MPPEDASQVPVLAAAPRQVHVRGGALITPITTVLGFAVIGWLFWNQTGVRRALAAQGRETQGVVTKLVWSSGSTSRRNSEYPGFHRYEFEYTAGGRTFSGRSGRFEENKLPAPGSKLPVTYLPEDPATALPMAKSRIAAGWLAMDWRVLGVAAVGAIGWWSLVPVALAMRREYRLARYGEAAVGTVMDLTLVPPQLVYQFRTQEGRDFRGEAPMVSREREKESRLTILYDPLNPARNIPLASFSYVKI